MTAWYRTGTVSISTASTTVTGSGTEWVDARVQVGDAIKVGEYWNEIASVVSNTQLTLATAYNGDPISGASYAIVPTRGPVREWVNSATAFLDQIAAYQDGPLAGRFGNGTAALPGMAFLSQINTGVFRPATSVLAISVNGVERARLTTSGMQLTGLLTGTAVTQSATDTTAGRLMKVGDAGFLLGPGTARNLGDLFVDGKISGIYRTSGATANLPSGVDGRGGVLCFRSGGGNSGVILYNDTTLHSFRLNDDNTVLNVARYYNTLNTTVDSNGFVKEASPIVRLFTDRAEEPVETVGATMTRQGVGSYTLSGVPPLATDGWQVEVPQDHNGNRLVFVETSYTGDTLTVTTSKPEWSAAQGVWVAGDPLDIPEGRWVDLRFWKDPEPEADPDEE